ncbi:enoyl-CoA hydratase-related protein [Sporichthya polymorpha]|uniref:enoyl-CoA hydratase-related protein n=1 Tax=Sporichthya polymorpha TaxID=35751 RepID=UPI000371FE4E|nr:enoyl-CoA hydratase-related protein [Sporichthya polymorpha]
MSDEPLVLVSTADGVATVTLNSPGNRNALSVAMLTALTEAMDAVEADDAARVVKLTHNGPVFSAGMDLKEAVVVGLESTSGLILKLLKQLVTLSKPVVVRLDGPVRAGGLGIVGAADVVISNDTVTFAFSEARIGVAPAIISLTTLPKMDPRLAHRWCLSGETFTAAQAAAAGLISEAVPPTELDAAVDGVIAQLKLASPQGLAETKKLLGRDIADLIDAKGEAIAKLSAGLFDSEEAKEGMNAFIEKRKPRWQV